MPPSDGQKKVAIRRRFPSFLRKKKGDVNLKDPVQEDAVVDGLEVSQAEANAETVNHSDAVDNSDEPVLGPAPEKQKKKVSRSKSLRESLLRFFRPGRSGEGKNKGSKSPTNANDSACSQPVGECSSTDKGKTMPPSSNGSTPGQGMSDDNRARTLSVRVTKEEIKKRWFLEGQDTTRSPFGNFTLNRSNNESPQILNYSSFYRSTPLYATRTNYTLRPVEKNQVSTAPSSHDEGRHHLEEVLKGLKKVRQSSIEEDQNEDETPLCIKHESPRSKTVSFFDELVEPATETNPCESSSVTEVATSFSDFSYKDSSDETQAKNRDEGSSEDQHNKDERITEEFPVLQNSSPIECYSENVSHCENSDIEAAIVEGSSSSVLEIETSPTTFARQDSSGGLWSENVDEKTSEDSHQNRNELSSDEGTILQNLSFVEYSTAADSHGGISMVGPALEKSSSSSVSSSSSSSSDSDSDHDANEDKAAQVEVENKSSPAEIPTETSVCFENAAAFSDVSHEEMDGNETVESVGSEVQCANAGDDRLTVICDQEADSSERISNDGGIDSNDNSVQGGLCDLQSLEHSLDVDVGSREEAEANLTSEDGLSGIESDISGSNDTHFESAGNLLDNLVLSDSGDQKSKDGEDYPV